MTNRTKWLLLGCVAVFGLYLADNLYRSWVEEPIAQLTTRVEGLSDDLQKTNADQLVAQKVGKRLEIYGQRALPYDAQLARSVYQEWLLSLVDKHRLESAAVDPGRPVPVEIRSRTNRGKRELIGHFIAYSLRGQATLSQIEKLLKEFRLAGHLHKIRSLSLNPTGNEGQLDLNLAIEVLSLGVAAKKDELSNWKLVTDEGSSSSPDKPSELVQRNLFARGYSKSLNEITLKAITSDKAGRRQAWFSLKSGGRSVAVAINEKLPVTLHEITVAEILPGQVLVSVNANPLWIELGQSIGGQLSTHDSESANTQNAPTTATPMT
ncbi:MAG: hypothetical protein NXI32_14110 [bacterium]|nr:hypothetical protein [bacterium]